MLQSDIIKPTLLLDKEKCLNNISSMVARARDAQVTFRPHFKTHQSQEVGRWFKAAGVDKITVSSLSMANYFASDGWEDITVAFPVNTREADLINEIAASIKLNLLVESNEAIQNLGKICNSEVGIFIKVDAGYGRTGVNSDSLDLIDSLIDEITKNDQLKFEGFLAHAGNSYNARGRQEIAAIHNAYIEKVGILKKHYSGSFPELIVSVGDTPTCSVMNSFGEANEIRPGCFVFYDIMQQQIGSCNYDQIALAVGCPVVAKHPERNEIVIYGGGVHLSKDRIQEDGIDIYGRIAVQKEKGWEGVIPDVYLKSLSQEHGIVSAPESFIENTNIGDILLVLPVHACMSADLMDSYLTTDGEWIEKRVNSNS